MNTASTSTFKLASIAAIGNVQPYFTFEHQVAFFSFSLLKTTFTCKKNHEKIRETVFTFMLHSIVEEKD